MLKVCAVANLLSWKTNSNNCH